MVVRTDLPRGVQAANIVHAAGESAGVGVPSGTHAVCLGVPDEAALKAVEERLTGAGVAFVRIVEPDAPYFGALMALGCVPARKKGVRRWLSSLPLFR